MANVYGYDMNFRFGLEAELAAAAGLGCDLTRIDFWRALGFDVILGLGRGCVTFSRDLLLQGMPIMFPADALVVGVRGVLRGDRELIDACRQLKDFGYELGYELDLVEFTVDQMSSPFLDLADIVRVSTAGMTRKKQAAVCADLTQRDVRPLASDVATPEQYEEAHEAGFWYFQGEFFREPALAPGRELPLLKAHHLALLREVNKPQIAYDELADLVKTDVVMTYRLLRFMNSAWYGLRQTVNSVRHALVLLGPQEIKLWVSLLVVRGLGEDKPRELFRQCLIRAKTAEAIAPLVGMGSQASELFLMGMFSLVEALSNVPLARVLEALPLNHDIIAALQAQRGPFALVYALIRQYEWGHWKRMSECAAALNLNENVLPALFGTAAQWADNALSSM